MIFKLFDKLSLMVLIDIRNFFGFHFFNSSPMDDSVSNIVGICEPYRVVLIFQKFTMHSDDLNVVQLRDEIAYFGALKFTILLLIMLYQFNVFTKGSKVVYDFILWFLKVNFGIELYEEGNTKSCLGLKTCLDACDIFLSLIFCRKFCLESVVCEYLGHHLIFFPYYDKIFVKFTTSLSSVGVRSFGATFTNRGPECCAWAFWTGISFLRFCLAFNGTTTILHLG